MDARFAWLEEAFGRDVPRKARMILPTPEFFPDPYEGVPDDVPTMLTRVAGYMGVNPNRFRLTLYSQDQPGMFVQGLHTTSDAAGWYVQSAGTDADGNTYAMIGLESRQLADPMALVATLAHEISHELLLGEERISADEEDHEPLTDLLTVFLGLGIFTANATITDRGWTDGRMSGWQTGRHGYLDQGMNGYALAKFAWARGERWPAWMGHVRPDVRVFLKKSLKAMD